MNGRGTSDKTRDRETTLIRDPPVASVGRVIQVVGKEQVGPRGGETVHGDVYQWREGR